jgi:hypothetical protein
MNKDYRELSSAELQNLRSMLESVKSTNKNAAQGIKVINKELKRRSK